MIRKVEDKKQRAPRQVEVVDRKLEPIKPKSAIHDPKGLMNLEFCCPKCNSKYFGTWLGAPNTDGRGEGHCKGPWISEDIDLGNGWKTRYGDYQGCDFKWDRKDDDLYFVKKNK